MDRLKRLRNEELHAKVRGEIAKQLHAAFDDVLKDELPPRLQDLLRHLEQPNTSH